MGDVPDPREIRDPDELLGIILDPGRRGELYPWYHRLRDLAPVHRSDEFLTRRAWVLTRFEDVRAALRHPRMRSDDRIAIRRAIGTPTASISRAPAATTSPSASGATAASARRSRASRSRRRSRRWCAASPGSPSRAIPSSAARSICAASHRFHCAGEMGKLQPRSTHADLVWR
jgi:hypothetical protein